MQRRRCYCVRHCCFVSSLRRSDLYMAHSFVVDSTDVCEPRSSHNRTLTSSRSTSAREVRSSEIRATPASTLPKSQGRPFVSGMYSLLSAGLLELCNAKTTLTSLGTRTTLMVTRVSMRLFKHCTSLYFAPDCMLTSLNTLPGI